MHIQLPINEVYNGRSAGIKMIYTVCLGVFIADEGAKVFDWKWLAFLLKVRCVICCFKRVFELFLALLDWYIDYLLAREDFFTMKPLPENPQPTLTRGKMFGFGLLIEGPHTNCNM